MFKRNAKSLMHAACSLTLVSLLASAALSAATLTVKNATSITLKARYKDRNNPWEVVMISPQQVYDFSNDHYFSITLYNPKHMTLAITSEQYTASLGFRPERHSVHDHCNDYQCIFQLNDAQHGVLTIAERTF